MPTEKRKRKCRHPWRKRVGPYGRLDTRSSVQWCSKCGAYSWQVLHRLSDLSKVDRRVWNHPEPAKEQR